MPPAGASRAPRTALLVLQLGAVAVVLLASPYKAFDLDRFFVPKELALDVTALAALLLLITSARRLVIGGIDLLLAGFLLLSAASAVLATNHWAAERALALSAASAGVFWAARAVARSVGARPILLAVALAAVLASGTALLQAYGVETSYFSINRSPGGTLGNRNFVAHIAALAAPALLLVALLARRAVGSLLAAAGIGLVAAALILSRSRAAWLALLVCGALLLWVGWRARRLWAVKHAGRRLLLLGVCGGAGAVGALALPNTLNWTSDSPYLDSVRGVVNYREGSGHGRIIQYRNSLKMAAAHPLLGVGPGNWSVVYPRFASRNDPSLERDDRMTANPWPSSDWVAYVAERGVPAFALLALTLAGLLVHAWRRMRQARSAEESLLGLALAATIVVVVIVGSFDAVLLLAAPALLAWAALGALSIPAPERRVLALSERGRRRLMLVAAGVGTIAAARSALQIASMEFYGTGSGSLASLQRAATADPGSYRVRVHLAERYLDRGRCSGARTEARAANGLYPAAVRPERLLAACGAKVNTRGR